MPAPPGRTGGPRAPGPRGPSALARVAVEDGPAFVAWVDCHDRAHRDASGTAESWLAEEWRARAGDDAAPVHSRLYRLGPAESPDAVAVAEYNDLDDPRLARAELFVDPARRRRGHGTALLAGLVEQVRALGRDTLMVRVLVIPGGEAARAALAFAGARGLTHTSTSVRRVWDLDPGALGALVARGRTRAVGYEVLTLDGPTPQALLAERARLAGLIAGSVPDAGAGAHEERWSSDRVRDLERHVATMGRRLVVALARERASGRLVGFSEVTVSRARPRTAYQWGTFVEPDHRGRGVAGSMKVAAARALVAVSPATTRIVTENDARNAPVIAMNEALGFRVSAENLVFVATL
ncbi:MAG TPA: GNAT family N-acetyltransferase [Acidimicrobiales bacterium]|nr:MAG: hypothetical protein B7Z69_01870 [Actinobacteria bacterium 21-73-9]HQU26297.1 GNAT family N-acetyltransferase [Acidimicrobiales bacterium]